MTCAPCAHSWPRRAQELRVPAPPLGVMIETPAAALLADQLVTECDFLSIGSNDLSQYTLAIDRLHPTLAARLDALHPSVLRLIDRAARAGGTLGIATSVCGNLAADPQAVPLLIGLRGAGTLGGTGADSAPQEPAAVARHGGLRRSWHGARLH